MKIVENYKKAFTNEGRNIIINSKKNLLSEKYQEFHEREGLFMRETNKIELDEIIETLSKKYCKKKKVIKEMVKKSIKLGYDLKDTKRNINNFYKNCY